MVKVLNFFAWDVLNIMRKVEYEKLNRNRIDFENGIWYIRVRIQKFNRELIRLLQQLMKLLPRQICWR